MNKYYDKRPMNALIAKAVEVCELKGVAHFLYAQYVYGSNTDSSLTEFKRRNGFEQVLLPKYFVPLTAKGALIIRLKLHRGLRSLLPKPVDRALLSLRAGFYEKLVLRRKVGWLSDESKVEDGLTQGQS